MERLTGEYKGRYGIKTSAGYMPAYEMSDSENTAQIIAEFQKGIDRLAEYENIGPTPEQLRKIDSLYGELAKEVSEYRKIGTVDECQRAMKTVERYETQYLDDMANPLEPLKLKSALDSELFKLEYRKEHKPKEISPLDYTIIYALFDCLKKETEKNNG